MIYCLFLVFIIDLHPQNYPCAKQNRPHLPYYGNTHRTPFEKREYFYKMSIWHFSLCRISLLKQEMGLAPKSSYIFILNTPERHSNDWLAITKSIIPAFHLQFVSKIRIYYSLFYFRTVRNSSTVSVKSKFYKKKILFP